MNSDVNLKFKHRFVEVHIPAREKARSQLKDKYLQLESLSPKQKIVALCKLLKMIDQQIRGFDRKEYILLGNDLINLYKVFSTNLLFYPNREAIQLEQAVNLIEECKQMIQQLKEINSPQELTRYIPNELILLDINVIERALNSITCHQTLTDILCSMAPNAKLIEQLEGLITTAIQSKEKRKTNLAIQEEIEKEFDEIFYLAYDRLKAILDNQPVEIKRPFIECMQRDLVYKKHLAQRNDKVFSHYYDLLIELFDAEWRYIQSVEICNHPLIEDILYERYHPQQQQEKQKKKKKKKKIQKPEPEHNMPLAFKCNKKMDEKLILVFNALILLKAIPPTTTLVQFRSLFNGKEITKPIEWWADTGDLMTFIKEIVRIHKTNFSPYLQHWNIAAKCFVQKGGLPFDPQKLRFSKPTMLEYKYIEAAGKFN